MRIASTALLTVGASLALGLRAESARLAGDESPLSGEVIQRRIDETAGCRNLVYRNVTLNGQRMPDGRVESAPGSDAPLKRTKSVSWESSEDGRKVK